MSNEEAKEYLKKAEDLEDKLTGEDKDTYQWLVFGYNECARLLYEEEEKNNQLKETIKKVNSRNSKQRLANRKLQDKNKQLKEDNKELEFIVGLRQKRNLIRKFDEEYDEEDKKKKPDRKYGCVMPDAEEVYKRYYKQKEVIEEVRELVKKHKHDLDYEPWTIYKIEGKILFDIVETLDKAKENK